MVCCWYLHESLPVCICHVPASEHLHTPVILQVSAPKLQPNTMRTIFMSLLKADKNLRQNIVECITFTQRQQIQSKHHIYKKTENVLFRYNDCKRLALYFCSLKHPITHSLISQHTESHKHGLPLYHTITPLLP